MTEQEKMKEARAQKIRALMLSKKSQQAAKAFEKQQQVPQALTRDLLKADSFADAENAIEALQDAVGNTLSDELKARYTMGGITLDPSQIEALEGLLKNRFAAMIGYAGSGKTTVIRFLTERLKEVYQNQTLEVLEVDEETQETRKIKSTMLPIRFAAITGRAAEVITVKMPRDMQGQVSTIHRLLGYHPKETLVPDPKALGGFKTAMRFCPLYDENNKLPFKCIVLDEAGMIPAEIWNNLLKAIQPDCRVYLVGDICQLPPLMGASPLPFAMVDLPCYELGVIHRQAEDSPIIHCSAAIRDGKMPDAETRKKYGKQMAFVPVQAYSHAKFDAEIYRFKIVDIIKRLSERGEFDVWKDIILTPIAKRESAESGKMYYASAAFFNDELRNLFNGNATRVIVKGGMRPFDVSDVAIGDKLMITRNGIVERATGGHAQVTNGMIGRVIEIKPNPLYRGKNTDETNSESIQQAADDIKNFGLTSLDDLMSASLENVNAIKEDDDENTRQCSHVVALEVLGRKNLVVNLRTAGDFSNLLYSYAITCHKAQGGEYRSVFVCVNPDGASMVMSREWLYTAVTRAQQQCVVLYETNSLTSVLKRQKIKGKTLAEKAASVKLLYSGNEKVKPIMPEIELI
jgi:ATP-dependent exoDNAse (exonuclease V) alpha subunit